jgi:hypothetical protein
MAKRRLSEVGNEIASLWTKPFFGAVPYIRAMRQLSGVAGFYGSESAHSIILYFLSNAATWRGADARRIKAELNSMLKEVA